VPASIYSVAHSESSAASSYGFRHFNDWKSHLIYFKLIKVLIYGLRDEDVIFL
jgi:hypothetical protein